MPRTTRATQAAIDRKAMEQNNDSYSDEDCESLVESRAHGGAAATYVHATDAAEKMRAQGGAALDNTLGGARIGAPAAAIHTLGGAHTGAPATANDTLGGAHIGAPAAAFNTERLLSTMMESFARMQAETNRTLVESLRSLHHGNQGNHMASTSAASPTANAPATSGGGNFAKCTARFDGQSRDTEVLEAFIDAVEVFKECASVTDEHALRGLSMLLSGDAAVWWRGARTDVTTWQDALARLRAAYGVQRPAYRVLREIFAHEHSESERAEVFISKVRSLLVKLPYVVPSVMIVDIVYGLLHRRIRKRLSRDSISNIDNLLERARTVEDSIAELSSNAIVSADNPNPPRVVDRSTSSPSAISDSIPTSNSNDKRNRIRCSYCKVFGHPTNECRKARQAGRDNTDKVSTSDRKTAAKAGTSNGKSTLHCYGCGQPGVVKSRCETCSSKSASVKQSDFNVVKGDCCTMTSSHPLVTIGVAGKEGVAIVDTGATHCVASPSLHALLVDNNVQFVEAERYIGLADGTRHRKMVQTATVPVTLGGRRVDTEFMVFPGDDTKTLLGRDFIANAGIVIDIGQESWHFTDCPEDQFPFMHSYVLSSAAVMHTVICDVSLRQEEGTTLSPERRAALNEFLKHRVAQFAPIGPPTDFAVHKIKVSETQEPLASPPYRLSPPKKKALERELHQLISSDVIEECESPWASNVVLVKKKDGSFRLCVDYRKLNAVTEPDRYPLPRIEDILHDAKTAKYMTTLDLRAGYYQVPVDPNDRDKTAFTTPLGTYRFKRMPMGLRNSGATFQRLIDRFKSNLPGTTLLAYLDDLLIMTDESFEKHLADLTSVFDRLAMFNLRVNREKSHFARESVKFLGHVILPGGIHVDPGKTAAIAAMPTPRNVKHLKCFLQTSSWFRRFIPDYAEVAKPLTALLKKVSVWRWGPEQQAAFEQIKQLLISAPILRQADATLPFVLRTDSSGYALGAVLLQGEGADERPVEYASRLLTAAERNYSTTEREALAVVWAVSKFRGYIDGAEVVIKSDHQPLRWLMSMRSPSGRLARWALLLQEYNLKIEYTPGKANVVADTLSRPACSEDTACDLCYAVADTPSRSLKDLRENQNKDPEVSKIVEALESDDTSRGRVWANKGYVLAEGVLYRYCPENEEHDDASLVVPEQERANILAKYHDAPTAGHMGAERTLQRLVGKYYWPGMRSYVTQYIKNCVPCQRYKADTRKPAGLLQTPASTRRFEVLAVDLFGPLPETAKGNKWILIVEDTCTRWVELFALASATSEECAKVLVSEVYLRFGVPRRLVSDNGVQFISEVMQQTCHAMGITQSLTSYYHPEANPVERKNRDLKPQLAILVGKDHDTWDIHLPAIRFAMNSAVTSGTGYSPAYLNFAREMRAPADATSEMRTIIENDNYVSDITNYLKRISSVLLDARDVYENAQATRKRYTDEHRRPAPDYKVGDLVLLKTQGANDTGRGQTSKFIPRRDGPYKVQAVVSPTTYILERLSDGRLLGKYHASVLTPFVGCIQAPVQEKRRRGRPRKS